LQKLFAAKKNHIEIMPQKDVYIIVIYILDIARNVGLISEIILDLTTLLSDIGMVRYSAQSDIECGDRGPCAQL
jgi:hypothetical protein